MRSPLRGALVSAVGLSTLAGFVLAAPGAFAAGTTTVVVSPSGTGDACTQVAPCSLATGQQAARRASAVGDAVDVQLRGGTYTLSAPLTLTEEDSGTATAPVTYEAFDGERPILSGARTLSGWSDAGEGVLVASTGDQDFRQLYVNGVRATPARWPNDESYIDVQQVSRSAKTISILTEQFRKLGADLAGMEVLLQSAWGESYLRFASAAPNAANPALTDLRFSSEEADILFQRPFPSVDWDSGLLHFQNARGFVDVPGEYSVDRATGKVYYLPRAGEDLQASGAQVPTLETLLEVSGTGVDSAVHDITIDGLAFEYTGWTRATDHGLLNAQGGHYNLSANMQNQQYTARPPAAVHSSYADRVAFTGNTFTHLGSTALDLDTAVHDSSATGNLISDISGNGIMVGKFTDPDVEYHTPYNPADKRMITARVKVTNNLITGTGIDYYGTAGINAGYVSATQIEHNDVSGSPWGGISLGWGWTNQVTALSNNSVSYNQIHGVITEFCDTAGIYHLSRDPGTVFDGNYIHDLVRTQTACPWPVAAFYLDEGSNGLTVRNNVMANVGEEFRDKGSTNVKTNNTKTGKAVIQAAGLEAAYRPLLNQVNVAHGRPTTSSSIYDAGQSTANAVDGSLTTGWSPTSQDASPWWQVDLGDPTTLAQVSLTFRQSQDQPETRQALEVRGSNDPTFATYTVLAKRDRSPAPDAGTFTAQVTDNHAYRYVRVAKTDGKYAYLTEFSAQADGGQVSTAATPSFDPNATYTLTNVASGLVAAMKNAATGNSGAAVQETADGQTDQQWTLLPVSGNLFSIVNVNSGRAFDNYASRNRGQDIVQWEINRDSNQLWSAEARDGGFVLRNYYSGQVLSVADRSTASGAALEQWVDASERHQIWKITRADAATVTPEVTSSTPANSAGWHTSPVEVTFTVKGAGASVESRIGSGAWSAAQPVRVDTEGTTTVEYQAVRNNAPVPDSAGQVQVKLDSVAPVTTVATDPAAGTAPLGQKVTATFTGTDATSGIDRTEYSTDDGVTWTTATADGVSFTDAGQHVVKYRSIDIAGNTETAKSVTLTVATTDTAQVAITSADAPTADGWYQQSVLVRLSAPTTGQRVQYRINGGAWRSYSSAVSVTANGTTLIDHRLLSANVVVAGSEAQFPVKIDKTVPTATATRTPVSGTGTPRNPIEVTFAGTDAHSGLDRVEYRVNSGDWTTVPSEAVSFGTVGDYIVSYRSVDRAGNTSTVRTISFTIRADPATAIRATRTTVAPGGAITFILSGYTRWDTVTITFAGSPLATIMTDQDGNARTTVRVPADAAAGTATIAASGTDVDITATGKVTVRR